MITDNSQDISRPTVPEVSIIFDKPRPTQQPITQVVKPSYKQWKQQQMAPNAPLKSLANNANDTGVAMPPSILNKKNVKFNMQPKINVDRDEINEQIGVRTPVPVLSMLQPSQQLDLNVFDDNFRRANPSPQIKYTEKPSNAGVSFKDTNDKIYENAASRQTAIASNDVHVGVGQSANVADLYQLTKVLLQQIENQQQQQNQTQLLNNNRMNTTELTPNSVSKQMTMPQAEICNTADNQNLPRYNYRNENEFYFCDSSTPWPGSRQHHTGNSVCMPNNVDHRRRTGSNSCVGQQHDSDEPTVKDLFKIIVKQQEQLIRLQEQVQNILLRDNNERAVTCSSANASRPVQTQTTSSLGRKAVGVMTSLEINIQQNYQTSSATNGAMEHHHNAMPSVNHSINQCQCECRFQPISHANDKYRPPTEATEVHNEIVDDPTDDDEVKSMNGKPPGWTFYGNILEQVNNVLENSPPVNSNGQQSKSSHRQLDSPMTEVRPSNIRMAHFKQFGFQCDDVNISATAKK